MNVYLYKRKKKDGAFAYCLKYYYGDDAKATYEHLFTVYPYEDKKEKEALAQFQRNQRAIELQAKGTAFVLKHKKKVKALKYFESFISDYDKKDYRLMESAVTKFKDYLEYKKLSSDILFSELTEINFKDFQDYLKTKAGLTRQTPRNYWRKFKTIIIRATKEDLIDKSVYEDVIFRKEGDDDADTVLAKEVLTEDEITNLMNVECGNGEVKKAFLFSCYTGLGLAEIKDLTWSNIKNNKLDIRRKKTGTKINNTISETALSLIGERKDATDLIFDLTNRITGETLSENGINKTLKLWVKRAEIEKHITFYCGRHTFATRLLMNNTNVKLVAKAMGHTNTNITNKYLNHIDTLVDEATAGLK